MNDRSDPAFTVPRSMLRAVAEADAAYGWRSLPPLQSPRVLDLAAKEGVFAVMAVQTWPGASVTCYEPDEAARTALVENTRGLSVECAASFDVAALGPADVMHLDTRAADISVLARYPHIGALSLLLVTAHDEGHVAQARSVALDAGFVGRGRYDGGSGRSTLRFVRADLLTGAAVDQAPAIAEEKTSRETEGLHPIVLGSVPLHLYVSMLAGSSKAWSEVENGLHMLGVLCARHGVGLTLVRERMTGVDRARNVQTERCLKLARTADAADRPTHMLHLDSDLVFHPEDILKLVRSNLDVVAIVYPRKEIDWDRVIRAVRAGVAPADLPRYAASFVFNHPRDHVVRHPDIGTLIEIEEVGTGCLMVKVDALKRYAEAYHEELEYISDYDPFYTVHRQFFHCERDPACARETRLRELKDAAVALLRASGDAQTSNAERAAVLDAALAWGRTVEDPTSLGRYLTEDYSFCRRWRLLGGKIYALMEADVGHIGKHVYRGTLEQAVPVRDVPPARGAK